MDEEQDYNINEINELVDEFKERSEQGSLGFYDTDDLEIIAEELIARFDFDYATEAIEHGLSLYPHSYSFRILKVKKFVMVMDIEEAEKELNAIEEEFPLDADFYLEKAFFLKMAGREDEVLPILKTAHGLDANNPEINIMLGGAYVKKRQYERALNFVRTALEVDDTIEDQLFTISYIFEEDKLFAESVGFFKILTEQFPLSKGCWFALGLAYSWVKDADNAIDAYQNAISLDEEASTAYFNIGNVYFEAQQFDQALHYYEEAYRMDNQDFHAVSGMADCYVEMHQFEKALSTYHEALSIDANAIDAIMGIINVLHLTGRDDEAEEFFKKSFILDPESFEQIFNILPLYDDEDQIAKLKELFQITIGKLKDKEGFLQFFTQYCTGSPDLRNMGIEILEELLDDEDVTNTLPYLLAALHYLNGNVIEGNRYLKNALLINYEGHKMFLSLSPLLESNPGIRNMIEMYKKE